MEDKRSEKVPIISLDVALPGGDQENLLIYDDDNLDDIVEVFSLNHRKFFLALLYFLIHRARPERPKEAAEQAQRCRIRLPTRGGRRLAW